MEETAVNPPLTIEAFLRRLRMLRASVVADLDSAFEIVEKTLRVKEGRENAAAAAAAPATVPCVQKENVAVLDAVKKAGREMTRQLGGVVHRQFEIDVGLIESIELGVSENIREFRPVSAETTQKALSDFVSGANNGDDFRLCLKAGADVNGLVEGQTALIKAVCANHTEAFETILSDHPDLEVRAGQVPADTTGVVTGDTAVIVASRQRRWEMVRSLVAKGANVDAVGRDGKKALEVACEAAGPQLDPVFPFDNPFRLDYDPQNGDPAVRSAVSEALKDLLAKTSDVADLKISARKYFEKESLAHFFSWHEFEELLLLSLSRGVDIDDFDEGRWTALMYSSARARPQYVQIILDNGANVNKSNGSYTPLATAMLPAIDRDETSIQSALEVCTILLDRGANVNSRVFQGGTVIDEAVRSGVTEFVRLLVERGADVQLTDRSGQTPHDLAVQRDSSTEIVALLTPPAAAN